MLLLSIYKGGSIMKIATKKFGELTTLELHEIFRLRSEIFVVEQNCVYNDVDGKDIGAIHIR
jgi:ElaA protein